MVSRDGYVSRAGEPNGTEQLPAHGPPPRQDFASMEKKSQGISSALQHTLGMLGSSTTGCLDHLICRELGGSVHSLPLQQLLFLGACAKLMNLVIWA